jgi:hypothetical protein
MQLSSAPSKIVLPFAADATGGDRNVIPVPSQIPITPGAASYTDGFPPLNFVDPTDGGIGPSGADFNGILNETTALSLWYNAGAGFPYDATFSAAVGGYPKGAKVLQASGVGYWLSITDNNVTDPDTGGAGWIPQGAKTTSSVFAAASQTLASGFAKILFDTIEYDSGFWDAVNKRFVALYPGKYRISGSVLLGAPTGELFATFISKNGAVAKQCCEFPQVSDGNLSLPFDATLNLAVGDFLEASVNVPGAPITAGTTGSNEAFVFAQLQYLGQ